MPYLSIALPFALLTTIGGIDNTESALAAGDEYRTRDILLTEAMATVVAGVCGGVVQNTPYIGHPAYKAMGARAGYTLATALVIGVGASLGFFRGWSPCLPEAAVATILIFIGLEITAQGFLASPPRHGAAVAIGFLPVVAALVLIQSGSLLAGVGKSAADLAPEAALSFATLTVLGNGFILTALLWSSAPSSSSSNASAWRRWRSPWPAGYAVRSDPLPARERRPVLAVGSPLRTTPAARGGLRGGRRPVLSGRARPGLGGVRGEVAL